MHAKTLVAIATSLLWLSQSAAYLKAQSSRRSLGAAGASEEAPRAPASPLELEGEYGALGYDAGDRFPSESVAPFAAPLGENSPESSAVSPLERPYALPGEAIDGPSDGAPGEGDPTRISSLAAGGWDVPGASPGTSCSTCGGGYPYNRCGCSSQNFPWFRGPGRSDQWCVGPHWQIEADGLIWRRDNADLGRLVAAVGVAPDLTDQFDYGPGARITLAGYNDSGYGLRVVYEGINQFDAATTFPLAGAGRSIDYHSSINSVEINFMPRTPQIWKLFGGFRYLQIDEDIVDGTQVDKVFPLPADPPAASAAFVDTSDARLLQNRLIGFQLGALRDGWQLSRRWSVEAFGNSGIYVNDMKRENVFITTTTVINGDDLATPDVNEFSQVATQNQTVVNRNFSELAFVGEIGISALVRVNQSTVGRIGYQALLVDGAGQGIDAFFGSGFDRSSILFHGLQFGLEYRR